MDDSGALSEWRISYVDNVDLGRSMIKMNGIWKERINDRNLAAVALALSTGHSAAIYIPLKKCGQRAV